MIKRVFFSLVGWKDVPGARERIIKYIPKLKEVGIETRVFVMGNIPYGRLQRTIWFFNELLKNIEWADIFLNYRCPFPKWQTWLIRKAAKKLYMDFDDAIFAYPPYDIEPRRTVEQKIQRNTYFVSKCDNCIVGNSFLSDWASKYTKTFIIPTCIDTDRYIPIQRPNNDIITIGWSGSPQNLLYLQACSSALSRIKRKYGNRVRIVLVSESFPNTFNFFDFEHERRTWRLDRDVSDYQEFDIGLMPLDDSDWSKGKCSLKALQHMSCCTPVVLSPVGLNRDVVTDGTEGFWAVSQDEWYEAIDKLIANGAQRLAMGGKARQKVIDSYSHKIGFQMLLDAFKTV